MISIETISDEFMLWKPFMSSNEYNNLTEFIYETINRTNSNKKPIFALIGPNAYELANKITLYIENIYCTKIFLNNNKIAIGESNIVNISQTLNNEISLLDYHNYKLFYDININNNKEYFNTCNKTQLITFIYHENIPRQILIFSNDEIDELLTRRMYSIFVSDQPNTIGLFLPEIII